MADVTTTLYTLTLTLTASTAVGMVIGYGISYYRKSRQSMGSIHHKLDCLDKKLNDVVEDARIRAEIQKQMTRLLLLVASKTLEEVDLETDIKNSVDDLNDRLLTISMRGC